MPSINANNKATVHIDIALLKYLVIICPCIHNNAVPYLKYWNIHGHRPLFQISCIFKLKRLSTAPEFRYVRTWLCKRSGVSHKQTLPRDRWPFLATHPNGTWFNLTSVRFESNVRWSESKYWSLLRLRIGKQWLILLKTYHRSIFLAMIICRDALHDAQFPWGVITHPCSNCGKKYQLLLSYDIHELPRPIKINGTITYPYRIGS